MNVCSTACACIAPYVIINDIDGPYFRMICQWVPGVGYCYLDRGKSKPRHDGMAGKEATPVDAFGIVWTDNADGSVSFYRSDLPATATYRDGQPRRWHDAADSAEYPRLTRSNVRKRTRAHA
jgi:hypothetical protein